jgi:hypothetical protein
MKRVAALVASVALVALVASMTFASASQDRPTKRVSWHRLVSAAPSSVKTGDKDHDKRLVVVERNSVETDIDNPPAGFSQGDEFASAGVLYSQGKKVGYSDVLGVTTFLSDTEVRIALTATATIRGDEISVAGSATFTEQGEIDTELSVVGGTGKYDDVGGELTFVESEQGTKLIFDLKHLD